MRRNRWIYSTVIIVVISFLTIGYSAFTNQLNIDDLLAYFRAEADIRITNISIEGAEGDANSYFEDYGKHTILSEVTLPNENSSVTYKIEVTNFGGTYMVISDINGLPDSLEYSLDNYELNRVICNENDECNLGITKYIYLTIKHKNPSTTEDTTTYNINLNFEFTEFMYTINYILGEKSIELTKDLNYSDSNNDSITVNNGVYTIDKKGNYTGLYIPAEYFEDGKTYLLTYKLKKISGTLQNIGGHSTNATQKSFTIDGISSKYTYDQPKENLSDDTDEHVIQFKFEYDEDIESSTSVNKKIYIQVNRVGGTAIPVVVNIYDIKLYEVYQEDTYYYNEPGELISKPEKTGYTLSWNTELNGSGTTYSAGLDIVNFSNINESQINLYAQWVIDGYTPLDTPADSTIQINTDYGLVDVIWLSGDSNIVSQTANEPDLYTDLGADKALTPVTWTYYEDGITVNEKNVNWVIDSSAKSTWYNYSAEKGNDGKEDNTTSMWANAINTDGSYFVWIPRYAYRITYYEDASYTKVTGYYDGYGMWNASDGKLKFDIDEGIETVEHDEKKYIVHPAFMNDTEKLDSSGNSLPDYDRGGWDKDLTGIWVAKYEMSRTGANAESSGSGYQTTFLSVPNVLNAGSIAIGNMYQIGKTYDSDKESHMIKNSEWGAVAYLTQSQYGRNGHEIGVNNGNLTGNGGVITSATDESDIYEYNTILGAKASTTGNVYGIYDMSGGSWEHVASYDKLGSRLSYRNDANKGTIILSDVTDASGNYVSTKYLTAYANGTDDKASTSKLFEIGKVGDATKEVRATTESTYWFSDNSVFIIKNAPYFGRGGGSGEGIYNGIFYSDSTYGQSLPGVSFRISLGK